MLALRVAVLVLSACLAAADLTCDGVNPTTATTSNTVSEPGPVTVTVEDDTATLSWTAAANAVDNYIVYITSNCSTITTGTSVVLENLNSDLQYEFVVASESASAVSEGQRTGVIGVNPPSEYCGVDTSVNGMTILSLFIGLVLGVGLGVVLAQILPRKAKPAATGTQAAGDFKNNPMRR